MNKKEKLDDIIKAIQEEAEKLIKTVNSLAESATSENFLEDHHRVSSTYINYLLSQYSEIISLVEVDEKV